MRWRRPNCADEGADSGCRCARYTERPAAGRGRGATLGEVLADLDRRFPGMRFRMIDEQDAIRRHIRIFVNGEQVRTLDHTLRESDEVFIVQALSGG